MIMQFESFKVQSFSDQVIFCLICLTTIQFSICAWFDHPVFGILFPATIILGYLSLFHARLFLNLLFFTIPLSIAIELPGGLATDLPGEPILLILCVITAIQMATYGIPKTTINKTSLLLLLHITWILVSTLFAADSTISLKYSLAKIWYIIPFYLFPFYILKSPTDIRSVFKYFVAGLLVASCYYFIQHFLLGLDFNLRINAGQPIWRNHVNYACTLVISLPIIWYLRKTSQHPDRNFYLLITALFLVFIYFAFARIAYVCLATALGYWVILKARLTTITIIAVIFSTVFALFYIFNENKYVHYAPDYGRAITHTDFGNKIAATTTGEDLSTMERVYRWTAGNRMIRERPVIGFGPGNFYTSYSPYTLHSFETYVSDNPDRSGIHNYFLMIWVEQGIIGLLLFISIIIIFFRNIQRQFTRANTKHLKSLIISIGITMAMIITINTVNDMIEVIKIGGVFFFLLFVSNYLTHLRKEEHPS